MSAGTCTLERPIRSKSRSNHDLLERRQAAGVQRTFLPHMPSQHAPGLTFTSYFKPVNEVGGDFYDLFRLNDGCIVFYLADVSGHDFAAAMVTVWLRQLLRHGLREHQSEVLRSPARTFEFIQKSLVTDRLDDAFVTMAYGVLDPHSGKVRYATAGHPSPLCLDGSSVAAAAEANGPLLSANFGPEIGWQEQTLRLKRSEGLLFFSDGIIDAPDGMGTTIGLSGLCDAAVEGFRFGRSADAIGAAVRRLGNHTPATDDLTLVLLCHGDN